jgi:hypothetical protein
MPPKLVWVPFDNRYGKDLWLVADLVTIEHVPNSDAILDSVAKWCTDTGCGKRMAYDMWKFKTKAELAMFLLRWA